MEEVRTRSSQTPAIEYLNTLHGRRYAGTVKDPQFFTPMTSVTPWYEGGTSEVMTDVVTPDFFKRIASGEIINNPMTKVIVRNIPPKPTPFSRAMLTETIVSGKKLLAGDVWEGVAPLSRTALGAFLAMGQDPERVAELNGLIDQAVTNAHAKASSDEISLLMVAAEGRKTVESMADILGRVIRVVKALHKKDLSYFKKIKRAAALGDKRYLKKQTALAAKELGDRYMEARYALRPLVYDAIGTYKAWNTTKSSEWTRHTARDFRVQQRDWEDTIPYSAWNATGTIKRTCGLVSTIRAGVLCDIRVSNLSVWGMDKVVGTMWEVLPYSFIIDWFANVGKTMASWTPSLGVRKLASWVTVKTVVTMCNELVSIDNLPPSRPYVDYHYDWSGKTYQYEIWKTRNVDPIRRMMPQVIVNLDSLKLLDLALILKKPIWALKNLRV